MSACISDRTAPAFWRGTTGKARISADHCGSVRMYSGLPVSLLTTVVPVRSVPPWS